MKNDIYPHANTIVCIEDSKLLKQFQYEILYNAKGLDGALYELNNINYFQTYKSAEKHNYGVLLDGLMKETFRLLKNITPTRTIPRLFALYYDIHNIKLVVKEKYFNKRYDSLSLEYGSYPMPTLRSASVRESDNILKNEVLTRGIFEALNRENDAADIDFILDKVYFKTLLQLAEKLATEKYPAAEIIEFITEKVDLYNMSAYFQSIVTANPDEYFRKAFSDIGSFSLVDWQQHTSEKFIDKDSPIWRKYSVILDSDAASDKEQLLAEFDVLTDDYFINKTKICKLTAFGILPICAYFFNKFMEIKNVRILLRGKESNYETGEIRKRMRIPYEI